MVYPHRPVLIILLMALFCTLLPLEGVGAQENPFFSGSGQTSEEEENETKPDFSPETQEPVPEPPSQVGQNKWQGEPRRNLRWFALLRSYSAELQRELYGTLSGAMRRVRDSSRELTTLLLVLAVSFAYGALHALGPGHRKTVLFSYFMARQAPTWQAVFAGAGMGLLHGAAAVLIILPLFYLVRGSMTMTFNSLSRSLELATFGFIALFGFGMLIFQLLGLLIPKAGHGEEAKAHSRKSLSLLIIGSGLIPCPGAAMVLIFGLSLEMLGTGLLAVAAMSLGMAFSLGLVAFGSMKFSGGLRRIGKRKSRLYEFLHHGLELGGYFLIGIFGLVMLTGML